jgi:uncharacterized membrane protein YhhN
VISEKKKLAISAGLILLAAVCLILFSGCDRLWCLAAMALSFAGDVLLLNIPAIRRRIRCYFPLGALAFGIAHVCYGKAYMTLLEAVEGRITTNTGTALAMCVIGVLIGYFAVSLSTTILPFALSFAGGTMLYVISNDMIPETHSHGSEKGATYSLLIGFCLMLAVDVLL